MEASLWSVDSRFPDYSLPSLQRAGSGCSDPERVLLGSLDIGIGLVQQGASRYRQRVAVGINGACWHLNITDLIDDHLGQLDLWVSCANLLRAYT